jgi:hypothetical protein
MNTSRFGFLLCVIAAAGGLIYLALVVLITVDGGMPPKEPYQTLVSLVTFLFIPVMLLIWVSLHQEAPQEKKVFSLGSLVLVCVFATLTSINRYNALTVVPQAKAMGMTAGLEWFEPYGWPSIMTAMEVQAWGFYLGVAFLCLAPVFAAAGLERTIFWTLIVCGGLCLSSSLGQMLNRPTLIGIGVLAWGPGLILLTILWALWFRRKQYS